MHQIAFKYHFQKMKYFLQGSVYKEVLSKYMVDVLQLGYELKDFKFIVYSRSDKYPYVWNMGSEWHRKGLHGFENNYGEQQRGAMELLRDYYYYVANSEVMIDRIFAEHSTMEL